VLTLGLGGRKDCQSHSTEGGKSLSKPKPKEKLETGEERQTILMRRSGLWGKRNTQMKNERRIQSQGEGREEGTKKRGQGKVRGESFWGDNTRILDKKAGKYWQGKKTVFMKKGVTWEN